MAPRRSRIWLLVLSVIAAMVLTSCSALDPDLNLLRQEPMTSWTVPGVLSEVRSELPANPGGIVPNSSAIIVRSLTFADEDAAIAAQAAAGRAALEGGWQVSEREDGDISALKQLRGQLSQLGITRSSDDPQVVVISISI